MTELRSRGGASDACVLRFNNERSAGVLVFWLDYDGKAVSIHSADCSPTNEVSTADPPSPSRCHCPPPLRPPQVPYGVIPAGNSVEQCEAACCACMLA
jgi:hypothetical protein